MIADHLRRTRDAFVAATQGLTDTQLSFRPGDTGWSIADIVEHMALTERTFVGLVTEKMPQGAAPTPGKPTDPDRFARLAARIPSRTERPISAPSYLVPKGTWPTVSAALAAFLEARAALIAAAEAPGDVGARVIPHRLLGELDIEEWLYFASLHCQRHVTQVAELRAAQGCSS